MVEYSDASIRLRSFGSNSSRSDVTKTEEQYARAAAEAVVEAAIWKRRLRMDSFGPASPVSEETRRSLVQLVLNDPSLTAYLFTDEAWERH